MSSEGVGLKHAHTLSVLENTFMATGKEFTFPVTDERVIGLLGSSSGMSFWSVRSGSSHQ